MEEPNIILLLMENILSSAGEGTKSDATAYFKEINQERQVYKACCIDTSRCSFSMSAITSGFWDEIGVNSSSFFFNQSFTYTETKFSPSTSQQ